MPQLDSTHVQINDCTVVWDAITRPEPNDQGNMRWALKVVVDPQNPDLQLAHQLTANCLNASEFKGRLPNGGIYPIGEAGPSEFNGLFTGFAVINASTFKMPNVHAESGQIMQPMQYSNLLYAGQKVNIIVNASSYNNKARGIALRLDGFMVKESQNAERLAFGSGGYDTSGAFGGQQNSGGYQQQQNTNQGNQQNSGGYQQQQNTNQGNQQNQQNQGQPQQATDFLPQNN